MEAKEGDIFVFVMQKKSVSKSSDFYFLTK